MQSCPNCAAELAAEYCQSCGQRRIPPDELSARRFFGDLLSEAAKLQVELKSLRSLAALFAPGRLTAAYLAGRRGSYLSPIKLYLVCAAIFFFAVPYAGFDLYSLMENDLSGEMERTVATQVARRGIDLSLFADRFDLRLKTVYTLALTVSMTLTALFLALLFLRRRLPFGAHLTFAIHYTSFLFFITLATGYLTKLGLPLLGIFLLAYGTVAGYVFVALGRVYSPSVQATLLMTALLLVMNIFAHGLVDAAAVELTLRIA